MANERSAIIVVVDRLGAAYLGPYGNTWLETPYLNQFAAESLLFDFPIIDSANLDDIYRAYWYGRHSFCPAESTTHISLPELLDNTGIETTLVTDADHDLQGLPAARHFRQTVDIGQPEQHGPVDQLHQSHLAQFFAAAANELASCQPPFLTWIHASGMQGPWDAPYDLRFQFADEDDPEPPVFTQPPSRHCSSEPFDPDELLGITFAYAGQVSLLDTCLGLLMDAVAQLREKTETIVLLTSPRGFPIGEHGRIGAAQPALYGELLHVPWMINFGQTSMGAQRSQSIVQPHFAYETLLDWFGIGRPCELFYSISLLSLLRYECHDIADRACSQADQQLSIRTPAWFLRRTQSGKELYAKPDDRWEVNEVSDRCPDVVNELEARLDEFIRSAQGSQTAIVTPLSSELRLGSNR